MNDPFSFQIVHLRKCKLCLLISNGNSVVAGHGQFQSSPHTRSHHSCHHRLLQLFQLIELLLTVSAIE